MSSVAVSFVRQLGLADELAAAGGRVEEQALYCVLMRRASDGARLMYVGAERAEAYFAALADGAGPAHASWADTPKRLQSAWRAQYRVTATTTTTSQIGMETATVYALRRALRPLRIEVTGGLYAMRGSALTRKRPLVENTITALERHEERECLYCGVAGCGSAVCTRGYVGILGICAAEEALAQQQAAKVEVHVAPAPVPKVEVHIPPAAAPAPIQVPAPAPKPAPAPEFGPADGWGLVDALPQVCPDRLRGKLLPHVHTRVSRELGESWVPLSAVAIAVGAAGDAAGKNKKDRERKRKAQQEKARDWADDLWPEHAQLALDAGLADEDALRTEEHVQRSGNHTSPFVKLDALIAMYGTK